jgi:hypothetical protein
MYDSFFNCANFQSKIIPLSVFINNFNSSRNKIFRCKNQKNTEMAELNIKHGPFIVIRRVIGVLSLISALGWLLNNLGDLKLFDWIYFIVFMISGGSLLTNGFGTEKSYFISGEDFLKIKWLNRLRAVIIKDTDIKMITLTRFKVIIDRKEGKNLNLNIDFLERDQKKELYDYLIEYARTRNLELVRDF